MAERVARRFSIDDSDGKLYDKLDRIISVVRRLRDTPKNRKKAERIKYRLESKQHDYYILLTTYNFMPGRFAADPSLASIVPSVCRRIIPRGKTYLIHNYHKEWERYGSNGEIRREPTQFLKKQIKEARKDLGWLA